MKTLSILCIGWLLSCGGGKDDGPPATADAPAGGGTDAADGPAAADGPDVDAPAGSCDACAIASCGTQYAACQLDQVCKCTYDCFTTGMGNEGACKQQCNSNQNTPWADMIDCLDTSCTCP